MCKRCALRPLPLSPTERVQAMSTVPGPGTVTVVRGRRGGAPDPSAVAGQLDRAGLLDATVWVRLHRLDRTLSYLFDVVGRATATTGSVGGAGPVDPRRVTAATGAGDAAKLIVERLPPGATLVVEDPFGPFLPEHLLGVLRDVAAASQADGGRVVVLAHGTVPWSARSAADALVAGPSGGRPPRGRVLRRQLAVVPEPERRGLALACETGYWRPDGSAATAIGPLASGLVPLDTGWFAVRAGWHAPLGEALLRCDRRGHVADRSVAVAGSRPPTPTVVAPRDEPIPAAVTTTSALLLRAPNTDLVRIPDRAGVSVGAGSVLDVRMLGRFAVSVDGAPVEWHGQRGPAVLRFLLAQPGRTVPRDVLLEQFWPEVDPAQARNRLQVALSCLRRSLRPFTTLPVVEHHGGQYAISAELDLTVDVEAFDRSRRDAGRAEDAGDLGAAVAGYQRAVDLYRGPFLADTPYDDWTIVPREAYRIAYLHVLDRLADLLEHADRINECVNVAMQMLEVDACHEEGHRLLMRSYLHMGRGHQALRQFELCRRALRTTLAVGPSSQTLGVYRAVRAAMTDIA